MSFFDGLIVPDPPKAAAPAEMRLGPYEASPYEDHPPADWFAPARIPETREVGAGPETRVVLTGWEVWPASLTIRLDVFRRRVAYGDGGHFHHGRPGADGLRFGVLLADGRRVTTLDGDPWSAPRTGPDGLPRPRLMPYGGSGGAFHDEVNLHLSQLPPEGPLVLVTEWPAEEVPETRTEFDAGMLRAAATEVLEIWPGPQRSAPGGPQQAGESRGVAIWSRGASDILAQPKPAWYSDVYVPPAPERDRADWEGMGYEGWADPELIRARLAAGADPDPDPDGGHFGSPLHRIAESGRPESVAELAGLVADVDALDHLDGSGVTALWEAVAHGRADNAAALLAAGADAWTPRIAGRSPGSLALSTDMAALFADLPGAVPRSAQEVTAQREADEQALVFRGIHTEGLSVAFVAGITEDEAVRRLGTDPERCRVLDLDREPGPYGTGPDGFDPSAEEAERFIGVTGVPGGCVLIQPFWYGASTPKVLRALSPGGRAYGVYFNAAGGTFGQLSVDGREDEHEEIGLPPYEGSPEGHWLHRFWQWGPEEDLRGARSLAYACARAGMRLEDGRAVEGPPRRWVELPADSPLLSRD
ncbi:ankyrin repeat domain-containing protein [Streptomyces sp. NPDC002886]|uniref:ankyrin repeat domain-containing protein n=1 Tax=Streptomyces sp. NPDC002886 TaxID=3364667 RepID=UPI0036C76EFD